MARVNGWHTNYAEQKPPQHRVVDIMLKDGAVLNASFLKDINKYIRNVNRWRIIETGKYIDDKEVKQWRYK